MCCCGKPTINGTPNAYSWDGRHFMTRTPNAPALLDGETLVYDEPGRCGGIDAHSHHFRLVRDRYAIGHSIRVRHGGGEECIGLGCTAEQFIPNLAALDSNARFWWMYLLYSAHQDGARHAERATDHKWRLAAAEKRIRTRKMPGRGMVKVWIEPPAQPAKIAA
jgi:hypothetical protein